jgi:hypothetical protein
MDERTKLTKFIIAILTASTLLLSACVQEAGTGRKKTTSSSSTGGDGTGSSDGKGAVSGGDDSIGDGTSSLTTLSEIRYIVDPFDGAFKTKLTIPKNFTGYLYLAGLNITSLKDQFVYVRFNFGRDLTAVEIPATISQAEGITPQTNVEVLTLDMNDKPFENIKLGYDLYDYSDYRDGTGTETGDVVSDPRDNNLFCRGLKLEYDPTFEEVSGTTPNSLCDTAGDVCKYAYAKILDSGLYLNGVSKIPTEHHYDVAGAGYASETVANQLKKCLPDTNTFGALNSALSLTSVLTANPNPGDTLITDSGNNYLYYGPYRTSSESLWEISGDALYSVVNSTTKATGLFQQNIDGTISTGYKSFLYPRAGKTDFKSGIEYYGATSAFEDERTIQSLVSSGESEYMEGCSIRTQNYDSLTNESIASCNVSATIELWVKAADGTKTKITESKDVKLQLIRSSETNYQGEEVMYSSLKNCSSSNACGSDECCFNKRCWSKEFVNQCPEDVADQDNRDTGDSCTSDFQCSSLCCGSGGVCADHVNTNSQQVLCNKSPGLTCVSQEWCRKENVRECDIYKTGTDASGAITCGIRCFNVQTFGDCINGICSPPETPAVPTFDEATYDCNNAKALP